MLTKDYINDEINKLCSELDELNEHSLGVLADLLFVKKNFHLWKCGEKFTKEMADAWVQGDDKH